LGSQPFRHFDALLKLSYPIIVQDLLKQNKGFAFFWEREGLACGAYAVEKLMTIVQMAGHPLIAGVLLIHRYF
jgi:hypothetical protein